MRIYLGLGANLGDRRTNLSRALHELPSRGVLVERVSPIVESPAMLPDGAADDWNRPYLNLVAECSTELDPATVLKRCKDVEAALGRDNPARWSPRPIDIDILLFGREQIQTDQLEIPHPGVTARNFALTPLVWLDPSLTVPGHGEKTVLQFSRALDHHIPLWMGIVNVTPDSFSDGGQLTRWPAIESHVEAMVEAGAHIIDLGAESTRPGATRLSAKAELERLLPALEGLLDKYGSRRLRPLLSVDTYHAEVAARALELDVDIINDVSGLSAPGMLELASSSSAAWIAMHHLTLPADPAQTLATDHDPVDQLQRWLEERLETWQRADIDLGRILFDPGIGFGKTALQSLQLLRGVDRLRSCGLRLLIGHSRKSFLAGIAGQDMAARDLNTVGVSLQLAAQGVDALRVHNVPAHTAAYRGWSHAR